MRWRGSLCRYGAAQEKTGINGADQNQTEVEFGMDEDGRMILKGVRIHDFKTWSFEAKKVVPKLGSP
jgi:hypothetical protein